VIVSHVGLINEAAAEMLRAAAKDLDQRDNPLSEHRSVARRLKSAELSAASISAKRATSASSRGNLRISGLKERFK
jgi:hypothetical protein